MTEQEAQAIIAAARTENPQMRQGKTLYRINTRLQRKGVPCVETYRCTPKHAIFERMQTIDDAMTTTYGEVRAWLESLK
jgi:hypothetical protein